MSRGSHGLAEKVVNSFDGLPFQQAEIGHSGGADVIVFEKFPTKSRNFATTMENITEEPQSRCADRRNQSEGTRD